MSDEGKGVNKETQAKFASGETAGVGVRGMQGRLKEFGGSVEIHSNGGGTTVTARIPLEVSKHVTSKSSPGDGRESLTR